MIQWFIRFTHLLKNITLLLVNIMHNNYFFNSIINFQFIKIFRFIFAVTLKFNFNKKITYNAFFDIICGN